eukprot:1148374-Amphidinium_carterae.1
MDVGEPGNPMSISELVERLIETSTTTRRQVDVLRVNLQRQQLDATHEEIPLEEDLQYVGKSTSFCRSYAFHKFVRECLPGQQSDFVCETLIRTRRLKCT